MIIDLIKLLRNYKLKFLRSDLIAGLSVASVSLPQIMAYALIAGLNPIYGIYTFIVSTFMATLTGVSNYMIVGPTNIIAVTIASTLNSLEIMGPDNYLQGVLILTFLAGAMQIILGLLQLGNLVNFVSDSVISGLTLGVALVIASGQLSKFLGLSVDSGHNVIYSVNKVLNNLDQINYYALMVGLISLLIILACKRYFPALPPYMMAVVGSVIVVYVLNLQDKIELVGSFQSSIPKFSLFEWDMELIRSLWSSALSIALIGFIQILSIVKAMEKRSGELARMNQEFIGQGITNVVCSFFNSFAITGSFTKSFANYEAGARTRLSELFAGLAVLLAVALLGPFVSLIPIPALATVVIIVAFKMFNKEEIRKNFQTTKQDALVFSVTFLTTIITPRLDYAIYLGVIISIIFVLKNTSEVDYSYISYNSNGQQEFSHKKYEDVKNDNYIIINLAGTIHFNSTENLRRYLRESYKEGQIFLIRMREISDLDFTMIEELDKFIDIVQRSGGQVILCGVSRDIYKPLENFGIVAKIGEENIFLHEDDIFSSTKEAIEDVESRNCCGKN